MKINYNCAICNENFIELSCLSKHINSHKLTNKNYYDIYHKNKNEGICLICNKETLFKNVIIGYRKYCSMSCRNKDKNYVKKCKNTLKNKLGENYSQIIDKKRKTTKSIKYGDENYNNRKQSRETCNEKYGVDNPSKLEEIKIKKENTSLKNNGVKYYLQSKEGQEKFKNSCLNNFGKDNPSKDEHIQNKKCETSLQNWGVKYPLQSNLIQNKIEKTIIEKFGVRNVSQNPEIHKKQMFGKFKAPNCKTYDSSWEYKFELYLVEHKINYEYQSSTTFKWIDYNGKERTYIPDFKLITENDEELVEIKGDYFFDKNGKFFDPYDKTEEGYKNAELKWKCMIENNVKILTSKELISLGIDLS